MKGTKWLAIGLCVMLMAGIFPVQCFAYERNGHDQYMSDVLFKYFKVVGNDPSVKDDVEALECASYLAIDQFNNSGQDDLNTLLQYGVKGIPAEIKDISFTASGKDHRSYTHRGWDFSYPIKTTTLWPLRKQILLNTAGTVFSFYGNEAKKNSFCAIIYYVHILGDHMDDKSYKTQNGLKMDVGGHIDDQDIISELLKHISVLFADQRNTHKFRSLTNALQRYDNKFANLMRSEGGVNSDKEFAEKQKLTEGLMRLLTLYFPEMLKEEKFFNEVFYK